MCGICYSSLPPPFPPFIPLFPTSLPLTFQKGFIKYADTLLRAQERQNQPPAGVWNSVAAYGASIGAIGFGALLALGVRQAFS